MKRSVLLLLTAIYIVSCVGMSVNRFYCCGKLALVTFTYGGDANNSKETGKKDNCCKNEKQCFKINDSHFNVASLSLNHPSPLTVPSFIRLDNDKIAGLPRTKIVYKGNAPPHPDIPVYTLNCTYRI